MVFDRDNLRSPSTIIDRHGGTVRVESAPGEDSTFLFTLPVRTGDPVRYCITVQNRAAA
jgi:light-regulated signal transduction histidine kinase (bacteriophytochrome)